jgi:hypothetical protein
MLVISMTWSKDGQQTLADPIGDRAPMPRLFGYFRSGGHVGNRTALVILQS